MIFYTILILIKAILSINVKRYQYNYYRKDTIKLNLRLNLINNYKGVNNYLAVKSCKVAL